MTAPEIRGRHRSYACYLPRRRSWGSFAFLTLTLATLLSALLAILSTLRRTLRLNSLATFAATATTSRGADILRPGLEVFVVAVPFTFFAFGIVLLFQIRIRILGIDCSARNRCLFA